MENKVKLIGTIIGIILFIFLISGITYAAFTWASDPTGGFINATSECFVIDYTKGEDILDGSLGIGMTYKDGLFTSVKAKLSENCPTMEEGIATLYIDTKDETSDYLTTNKLLRYQVLENGSEVSSGVISNKGKTKVYENISITDIEKELTVYIWVSMDDITDEHYNNLAISTYSGGIQMTAEGR